MPINDSPFEPGLRAKPVDCFDMTKPIKLRLEDPSCDGVGLQQNFSLRGTIMSNNLVCAFNALPQPQTITSQHIPNEWYFDLRFTRRLATASFILLILQPRSGFFHITKFPFRSDTPLEASAAGLEFFPDTPQEAAPEIVKALLHFFVNVLYIGEEPGTGAVAPWQWTTWPKTLAHAVTAEIERQGVCLSQLCTVGVASAQVHAVADARVKEIFEHAMKEENIFQMLHDDPYPESVSLLSTAPKPLIPEDYKDLEGPARYARMARHYGAMMARGAPREGGPCYGPQSLVKEHQSLFDIQELLMESPVEVVKSAADIGDAGAALDYGIRLSLGLDCEPSRKLSRVYLMKAADSEAAADRTKAIAHGLLIFWYYDPSITEPVPVHFVYAACHHASRATFFFERASPPNFPVSPAVIWFIDSVIDFNDARDIPSGIYMLYPNIFSIDKGRAAQIRDLEPWALKRRLDRPHKYFCAAVDCAIQVDFSRALSECTGRCDKDKKPSYCSWQCQKADWHIHRPFCRPGARCSVAEDASVQCAMYGDRTSPAFRIQIDPLEEDAPVLRSCTLTATQLKALKPFSENPARFKFPIGLRKTHNRAMADDVTGELIDTQPYSNDVLASPQSTFSEESLFPSESSTSYSSEDNAAAPVLCPEYASLQQNNGLNNKMAFYPMIGAFGLLGLFFSN